MCVFLVLFCLWSQCSRRRRRRGKWPSGCRVDRKENSDVKWQLTSLVSMTVFCKLRAIFPKFQHSTTAICRSFYWMVWSALAVKCHSEEVGGRKHAFWSSYFTCHCCCLHCHRQKMKFKVYGSRGFLGKDQHCRSHRQAVDLAFQTDRGYVCMPSNLVWNYTFSLELNWSTWAALQDRQAS